MLTVFMLLAVLALLFWCASHFWPTYPLLSASVFMLIVIELLRVFPLGK